MTGSAGSTTGYTQDLFGVDVSGGGLAAAVHPGELELGAGLIAGPYNEATKKLPVAVDAGSLVARWRTDYEVDFSTLPDQTLGDSDGNKTIDGRTWIVANSAAEYNYDMQIVNGGGLRSNPSSGETYAAGNCPIISVQGTEIWDADLDPETPVRMSLLCGNCTNNSGWILLAHDVSEAGAGGVGTYFGVSWSADVTPFRYYAWQAGYVLAGSSIVISTETGYDYCDCLQIVRPRGVYPLDALLKVGQSAGGAFPAAAAWYPVRTMVGMVGYPANLRKERGTFRYSRFAIAFQKSANWSPHYLEVKKLKIETFR